MLHLAARTQCVRIRTGGGQTLTRGVRASLAKLRSEARCASHLLQSASDTTLKMVQSETTCPRIEARRAMSFEIVPVEDNQHQGRNSDRELVPRTLTTHLGRQSEPSQTPHNSRHTEARRVMTAACLSPNPETVMYNAQPLVPSRHEAELCEDL